MSASDHPDDTPRAMAFMVDHAERLIATGVEPEAAAHQAIVVWARSLERLRALHAWQQARLRAGQPTLRVSLFELAAHKSRSRS